MRKLLLIGMAVFLMAGRVALGDQITVSAAISMKEALTEIGQAFDADGQNKVVFNFGASGMLATQIAQGAPVDAFISAGVSEMDTLAEAALIDPQSRRTVCLNTLVLIVPAGAANPPASFADLAKVAKIAIGQPKSVPAGHCAMQTLTNLKIAKQLNGRLVYAANVRQVLDYVQGGEVDAGIVYATDAAEAGKAVTVVAVADESLHDPIEYPAAVIKGRPASQTAAAFLKFVESDAGRKILSAHHFELPSSGATTKPDTSGGQ